MNVFDLLTNTKDFEDDQDEKMLLSAKDWLKEAGFPQYVQMFNDNDIPISLKSVQDDHMDFDGGNLMALFRRIEILNSAAAAVEEKKKQNIQNEKSSLQSVSAENYPKRHRKIEIIKAESDPLSEDEDDEEDLNKEQEKNNKEEEEAENQQFHVIKKLIVDGNEDDEDEDDEDEDDEEDDDDDERDVLEQTALSSRWSYEPRTRRWSHVENQPKQPPHLQEYLGVVLPAPFVSGQHPPVVNNNFEPILEEESSHPPYISQQQKSAEPTTSLEASSQSDSSSFTTTTTAVATATSMSDKDKYIHRSTSLKLFKVVSRLSPNQFSFRHSKINKSVIVDRSKTLPSPSLKKPSAPSSSETGGQSTHPRSHKPPNSLSVSIPQLRAAVTVVSGGDGDSCLLGNSGWLNVRTGSFIARGPVGSPPYHHHTQPAPTDLDPVLSLLEADVRSLDIMRSNIRSKSSPDCEGNSPRVRPQSCNLPGPRELLPDSPGQHATDDSSSGSGVTSGSKQLRASTGGRGGNDEPVLHTVQPPDSPVLLSSSSELDRKSTTRWSHTAVRNSATTSRSTGPEGHLFQLAELSVSRMNLLRKLAVLGCTSTLEGHCPTQKNLFGSWRLPRLLTQKEHRNAAGDGAGAVVFGVNLAVHQSHYGQPYPPTIIHVFHYLRQYGPELVGVFRKTGMKNRIRALRQEMELDPELNRFDDYNVNDVADVLKSFFRELPDRIFTSKLSTTLLAIYTYVPRESQYEGLQWVLLSLPDENRIALIYLLEFLYFLTKFSDTTKMDARNLSLCLAPSLFSFQQDGSSGTSPLRSLKKSPGGGPGGTGGGPAVKQLAEQNAAHLCLVDLIEHVQTIFQVREETLKKTAQTPEQWQPLQLVCLNAGSGGGWHEWMRGRMERLRADLGQEGTNNGSGNLVAMSTSGQDSSSNGGSGWRSISREALRRVHDLDTIRSSACTLAYRKVGADSLLLRTWRVTVEVHVSAGYLFSDIRDRRTSWDPQLSRHEVDYSVNEYSELVHCAMPNPDGSGQIRGCHFLQAHQLSLYGCWHVIVGQTISGEGCTSCPPPLPASDEVEMHVLRDDFVVEPLVASPSSKLGQPPGASLSRVTWISRVDIKGHNSDWYIQHWGHALVRRILALKRFSELSASQRLPTPDPLRETDL